MLMGSGCFGQDFPDYAFEDDDRIFEGAENKIQVVELCQEDQWAGIADDDLHFLS